jgi:hypothetical protein
MSAMDDTHLANANEKAKRREKQNFYDIDNRYCTFNDADKTRALENTPATFNGSIDQQKVDLQSTSKSCLYSHTLSPNQLDIIRRQNNIINIGSLTDFTKGEHRRPPTCFSCSFPCTSTYIILFLVQQERGM